jgi:hypothetical protein
MDLTANEVAKRLPDFDDLLKLTENIGELLLQKLLLEKDIKNSESKAVYEATINPIYQQNGKAPSMSFIESTLKYTGINNETLVLREKQAYIIAELEKAKSKYDLYKELIDIWQTLSYSEKKNTL